MAGRVRYQADGREALPAVGDWVAVTPRPKEGRARIECILPRSTKLSRKVAGRYQSEQIVAANLDVAFVVTSLNRDLNPRRIERYLSVVWESGARPVVLLNKSDLCADAGSCSADIESIALGVPVHSCNKSIPQGKRTRKKKWTSSQKPPVRNLHWISSLMKIDQSRRGVRILSRTHRQRDSLRGRDNVEI
jgi:putative ribosome biogenesis GTPase RsgA